MKTKLIAYAGPSFGLVPFIAAIEEALRAINNQLHEKSN